MQETSHTLETGDPNVTGSIEFSDNSYGLRIVSKVVSTDEEIKKITDGYTIEWARGAYYSDGTTGKGALADGEFETSDGASTTDSAFTMTALSAVALTLATLAF